MELRKKNKGSTVSALMKNKEMANLIGEAINSPLGSTARSRAKKVVSVMKRTSMDGQGGPGIPWMPQPKAMYAQPDYSKMYVFSTYPGLNVKLDGSGGPGLPPAGPQSMYKPATFSPISTVPTPSLNTGGQTTPAMLQGGQPSVQQSTPSTWGDRIKNFGMGALNTAASAVPGMAGVPSLLNGFTKVYNALPRGSATPVNASDTTSWTSSAGAQNQGQYATLQTPQEPGSKQTAPGGYDTGYSGSGSATYSSPLSQFKGIQDAVNSGMGPTMFAYGAMNNPDLLKSLPGFENVPPEALQGGTLSGRINDLSTALRQQYNLDSLLNQKDQLVAQGVTITDDLTDYIRGRDEYLNHTQDMIDGFSDKMLTMDLANPTVNKQATSYMNYLYTLRGRQNKRYIEFLNSGINQFNGQLQAATDSYNVALDGFERELNTRAAVTEEEYNTMFNALSEMYTNVEQAPFKAAELAKLRAEEYAAYVRAAKDASDASGYGSDSYIKSLDSLHKLGAVNVVDGQYTQWNEDVTLADLEDYAQKGVDITDSFRAMKDVGRMSLTAPDADGNVPTTQSIISKAGKLLSNFSNLAYEGLNSGDSSTVALANGARQDMIGATAQALSKQLSSSAPTVKSAVEYLGQKNGMIWNRHVPTRTEFLSSFDSSLDGSFLNAIYDDFEDGYKDNPKAFVTYFLNGDSGPLSDSQILNNVSYSVASKLGASTY